MTSRWNFQEASGRGGGIFNMRDFHLAPGNELKESPPPGRESHGEASRGKIPERA